MAPRIGADLDRALGEVARNAAIYRGLAAEASRSNFHDVAEALSRAGAVLSINKTLTLPENFYLEIHGIRDEIPCTEFKRDGEELVVRFNMFLDVDFLNMVLGRQGETHDA